MATLSGPKRRTTPWRSLRMETLEWRRVLSGGGLMPLSGSGDLVDSAGLKAAGSLPESADTLRIVEVIPAPGSSVPDLHGITVRFNRPVDRMDLYRSDSLERTGGDGVFGDRSDVDVGLVTTTAIDDRTVVFGQIGNVFRADTYRFRVLGESATISAKDAEQLALEISGELLPPADLVETLFDDLETIRRAFPEMTSITHRLDWMPGELMVWTHAGASSAGNGGSPTFEELNAQYGVLETHTLGDPNWHAVRFQQPYHSEALASIYAAASDVERALPNLLAGGGNDIEVSDNTYTFKMGWGDCFSGCINGHTWVFTVNGDSVELVDEYGDTPPVPVRPALATDPDGNVLDGEFPPDGRQEDLPSGDGLPGGDFVTTWTVVEPTDLGTVDYLSTPVEPSADADLWFRLQAGQDAVLSVQANKGRRPGGKTADLQLELFDFGDHGQWRQLAEETGRIDYHSALEGQEYFVCVPRQSWPEDVPLRLDIVNLVQVDSTAGSVTVLQNDTVDLVAFQAEDKHGNVYAGWEHRLTITDVDYAFDAGQFRDFRILPVPRITLWGSAGAETFDGEAGIPPNVDLSTADPYGGTPRATLAGEWGTVSVRGRQIDARGRGGPDHAVLRPWGNWWGEDVRFEASGSGAYTRATDWWYATDGFETIEVLAGESGPRGNRLLPYAELHDFNRENRLVATPENVSLQSGKWSISVDGCPDVLVVAGEESGTAELHDSAGNDLYVATPRFAGLSGSGYSLQVREFSQVTTHAHAGGVDVAKLFDSPGNDLFVATPTYAGLSGDGFHNEARGFDGVHAYATAGGVDVAMMYDSTGDDRFVAYPDHGAVFRPGEYYNRAKSFEGVHAYATAGGRDEAQLLGSHGDDRFVADPIQGALFRPGEYYNRAKFFEQVDAYARQGENDRAELHDSELDDLLEAHPDRVQLSNATLDFLFGVEGFDYVRATATSSGDSKSVADSSLLPYELDLAGPWRTA